MKRRPNRTGFPRITQPRMSPRRLQLRRNYVPPNDPNRATNPTPPTAIASSSNRSYFHGAPLTATHLLASSSHSITTLPPATSVTAAPVSTVPPVSPTSSTASSTPTILHVFRPAPPGFTTCPTVLPSTSSTPLVPLVESASIQRIATPPNSTRQARRLPSRTTPQINVPEREYEVQQILDHALDSQGIVYFQVQWLEDHDITWEPATSLQNASILVFQYTQRRMIDVLRLLFPLRPPRMDQTTQTAASPSEFPSST